MTFAAMFAVAVGLLMIGQWTFFLVTKQVPELKTEPARILLHIAGEFATAIALIIGGAGLLANTNWGTPVYLIAMGMLLYTLIVSPGYYVQKRVWPLVGMFAVVMVLALISLSLVL